MKLPKFAKPKKISKSKLQKKCDILFSLITRHIGICEAKVFTKVRCGGQLQCAHIVGRTNRRLRWDSMNAISMCAGHHRYFTTHNEQWWLDFIPTFFRDKFTYVQKYRNILYTDLNLESILADLQRKVDSLQLEKK